MSETPATAPQDAPKTSGAGISYSMEMKRVHVTVNERDTTISMDMALYECLRDQLVSDGLTVRRWAQGCIDQLLARYSFRQLNRRANGLSRRVQREAIRLITRRLSQLEARLQLASSTDDEPLQISAAPVQDEQDEQDPVSLDRVRKLLASHPGDGSVSR